MPPASDPQARFSFFFYDAVALASPLPELAVTTRTITC